MGRAKGVNVEGRSTVDSESKSRGPCPNGSAGACVTFHFSCGTHVADRIHSHSVNPERSSCSPFSPNWPDPLEARWRSLFLPRRDTRLGIAQL